MNISTRKLVFLIFLWASFIFPISLYSSALIVDYAYIRKAHQFDFGTIHIFLKNLGEKEITINKVFLNDICLENLPNESATWMQILPNPILPKDVSDLMIRLPKYVDNYTLPFQVKIETNDGEKLEIPVGKAVGSFKITGIYFNDNLDKVYIYLQNTGKANLQIDKVYFGPEDVSPLTKFLSSEVDPEEKTCLITTLKKAFPQGKYLTVKIANTDGEIAESLVRVFSFFPITSWDGDTRTHLYFDPNPFHINYSLINKPEEIKELQSQSAWYLLGCPNCTDLDLKKPWGNSANEIIKRAQKCYQIDPSRPSHTHVCEAYKEMAYFIYGEVCDIMFINPYEVVFHRENPEKNRYFAKLGKLACEPRPLMTIPEAFTMGTTGLFPSPEEERLTVCYQISEGVKGISYYLKRGYQNYPELEQEIGKINQELQVLKPYLKIGEPFSNLAFSSEPKIIANTILSGNKGIVLILINKDYKTTVKEGKRYTAFSPKQNFPVGVKIPFGLNISKVVDVSEENRELTYQKEDEKITIPIAKVDLTKVILLATEDLK